VQLKERKNLFLWCSKHEGNFLIIAYLVKKNLRIHGNQIEEKQVFFFWVSIFIGFHYYRVGMKNLDFLVLLIKKLV
jgi:hypothetical protein